MNPLKSRDQDLLRKILEELLEKSLKAPGFPMRKGLKSGLVVSVLTKGGETYLQIDRARPGPNENEWNTVLKNWPFDCQGVKPKIQSWQRRFYWSAKWPTSARKTVEETEPCTQTELAGMGGER